MFKKCNIKYISAFFFIIMQPAAEWKNKYSENLNKINFRKYIPTKYKIKNGI